MSNLEQALAQLVEALKAGRAYSHTATNEYERRFFLQELLGEIRRYQHQADIPESDSISIVPAFLPLIARERSEPLNAGQVVTTKCTP
jgi:hypothetical protein